MPEATEKPRRRRGKDDGAPEERAEPALDQTPAAGGDQDERPQGRVPERPPKVTSELRDTVREAAIEVLRPVAEKATTSAAKYAVSHGPDMVKDKVMPKVEELGGAGAFAKGALSKGGDLAGGITGKLGLTKGKKGGAPVGTGRGRRLPVQEHVDVGVPIDVAYDQWTQFEELPRFMHRVEQVEQRDDTTLMWHENIWGVRRSWEAEIIDQHPCERIAWRSKAGPKIVGVVTFHELSDNLTRVQVTIDVQPQGLFEKAASGFRITRRALKSDLMRFKAYIEIRDEAVGAWRGRIEGGEVVETPDERERRGRKRGADRPEPEEDEGAEEELEAEEEEPEAEAGEEPEVEDYEEDDEDEEPVEKPVRRRPARKASTARASTRRRR